MSFDSDSWKQESAEQFNPQSWTIRQRMLGDLLGNVVPGKGRAHLLKLLGPSVDDFFYEGSFPKTCLIYCLGAERGMFGIDSEWLVLYFDDSGMFVRHEIAKD